MKFLECPKCGEEATSLWQIFVFPSRFSITKKCKSCNVKLRYNHTTLTFLAVCVGLWVVLAKFVLSPIYNMLEIKMPFAIDLMMGLLVISVPLFMGKKLFKLADKQ